MTVITSYLAMGFERGDSDNKLLKMEFERGNSDEKLVSNGIRAC